MLRFFLFLALFLALLGALAAFRHRLGARKFAAAVGILCASFAGAFVYSALDNSAAAQVDALASAFAQGRTLRCCNEAGECEQITRQTHNFNRGTMIFMHKSTNAKTPLAACSVAN